MGSNIEFSLVKIEPPVKAQLSSTDFELEAIPRAIYNDYIDEMKYRVEGISGLSNSNIKSIYNMKYINETDFVTSLCHLSKTEPIREADEDGIQNQTQTSSSNPQEERTVIFTDWGIDILNFSLQYSIRPIDKPQITCPAEAPVYAYNRRAIKPDYKRTKRYGSRLNTLAAFPIVYIEESNQKCKDMNARRTAVELKNTLKYTKKFIPKPSSLPTKGLSFLARGKLDVRMGWSKNSPETHLKDFKDGEDITESIQMNFEAKNEPVSFAEEIAKFEIPKRSLKMKNHQDGKAKESLSHNTDVTEISINMEKNPPESPITKMNVEAAETNAKNAEITPPITLILENPSIQKNNSPVQKNESSPSMESPVNVEEEYKWIQEQKKQIFANRQPFNPWANSTDEGSNKVIEIYKKEDAKDEIAKLTLAKLHEPERPSLKDITPPKPEKPIEPISRLELLLNKVQDDLKKSDESQIPKGIPLIAENSVLKSADRLSASTNSIQDIAAGPKQLHGEFESTDTIGAKDETADPKIKSFETPGHVRSSFLSTDVPEQAVNNFKRSSFASTDVPLSLKANAPSIGPLIKQVADDEKVLSKAIKQSPESEGRISIVSTTESIDIINEYKKYKFPNVRKWAAKEKGSDSRDDNSISSDAGQQRKKSGILDAVRSVFKESKVDKRPDGLNTQTLHNESKLEGELLKKNIPKSASNKSLPEDEPKKKKGLFASISGSLQNLKSSKEALKEQVELEQPEKIKHDNKSASSINPADGSVERNLSQELTQSKINLDLALYGDKKTMQTTSFNEQINFVPQMNIPSKEAKSISFDILEKEIVKEKSEGVNHVDSKTQFGSLLPTSGLGIIKESSNIQDPVKSNKPSDGISFTSAIGNNGEENIGKEKESETVATSESRRPSNPKVLNGAPLKSAMRNSSTKSPSQNFITLQPERESNSMSRKLSSSFNDISKASAKDDSPETRESPRRSSLASDLLVKQSLAESAVDAAAQGKITRSVSISKTAMFIAADGSTYVADLAANVVPKVPMINQVLLSPASIEYEEKKENIVSLEAKFLQDIQDKATEMPPLEAFSDAKNPVPLQNQDVGIIQPKSDQHSDKNIEVEKVNLIGESTIPSKNIVENSERVSQTVIEKNDANTKVIEKENKSAEISPQKAEVSVSNMTYPKELEIRNIADLGKIPMKREDSKLKTEDSKAAKKLPVAIEMLLEPQENDLIPAESQSPIIVGKERRLTYSSFSEPIGKMQQAKENGKTEIPKEQKTGRFMNAIDQINMDRETVDAKKAKEDDEMAIKKAEAEALRKRMEEAEIFARKQEEEERFEAEQDKAQKWLRGSLVAIWKDHTCEISVKDFEFSAFEIGKGSMQKLYKPYLPINLRRIISLKPDDSNEKNILMSCILSRDDGKAGGDFKRINLSFTDGKAAVQWREHMLTTIFGGTYNQISKREILFLVEKSDHETPKIIEKYMSQVFDAAKRPYKTKIVQYNDFSLANALESVDFSNLGNIVCTNSELVPRLQQVLVRLNHSLHPIDMICDPDPIDGALDIIRSCVGRSRINSLYVSGAEFKRIESLSLKSIFKKK